MCINFWFYGFEHVEIGRKSLLVRAHVMFYLIKLLRRVRKIILLIPDFAHELSNVRQSQREDPEFVSLAYVERWNRECSQVSHKSATRHAPSL